MNEAGAQMKVLVTGATGYVGGRLVPRLLERGHTVRVLVRDGRRVLGRPWASRVQVVEADLLEPDTLGPALEGIDAAYYLVHSMGGESDFAERDRRAATNFAEAGAALKHVIYLGGLVPRGGATSQHLRSREETGRILRERLPATEFRAGPIIGSGSASFEMVRYLTERLPVMVAPRWVLNEVQPIAMRSVLAYLLEALERQPMGVVSIGGERLTFLQMMQQYAAERGLMRRLIVPVPVLAPWLAARWVGLVTPISNRLAVPLVEGMVRPLVIEDHRAAELFPQIESVPYREAVRRALARTQRGEVETRWTGALGASGAVELRDWEGRIREVRRVRVAASAPAVFAVFSGLGGRRGWLTWNWAWWLRGVLDKLLGGPGLRRGRRHPTDLLPGEAVDWWRVEAVEPPRMLRLRAEMKVPGRAWLQWTAEPRGDGAELVQTAIFEPKGLAGVLYWWGLYPLHRLIFTDLVRAIGREAERGAPATATTAQTPAAPSPDTPDLEHKPAG